MIVERNQIFNLMDTNGRRSDVLNALKIYLEILEELKEIYPTESWGTYPASLSQFLFYEKALEKSKDVFKIHSNYDSFIDELGDDYQTFIDRDGNWIENNITKFAKVLDEAIEKRARHYTSNLVKMGFTTTNRSITEAGYSYLRGSVVRDELEELLPLDNVNIALFRQLSKLKIFDSSNNGKRRFYSPFIMALILLLDNETIDEHSFEVVVQGLSPYSSDEVKEAIRNNEISIAELEESIRNIDITIPEELIGKYDIDFDVFKNIFKGSKKNDSISKLYYDFFSVLRDFRNNKTEETYVNLINCLDQDNIASIYKAFGYGKAVFAAGNKGSRYNLERFLDKWLCLPFLMLASLFIASFLLSPLALLLLLIGLYTFSEVMMSGEVRSRIIFVASLLLGAMVLMVLTGLLFDEGLSFYASLLIVSLTAAVGLAIYALRFKIAHTFITLALYIGSVFFLLSVEQVFNALEPHQQNRILSFMGIINDPAGADYNVNQSKIAIGSGGLFGKGFLQGTQIKYGFVPERHTDFIFCTVGEEWGFLGTFTILTLFACLILRLMKMGERQEEPFGRIYCYCVASILLFHVLVNVGMTIGLMPVMGIPLPFMSYGGSSLIAFTILLFIAIRLDASTRHFGLNKI